jgi:type VI protein secretion system component VasK
MNGNWLAQLAPEHAPAAPSWWPPALGWWLMSGSGLLLVLAYFAWRAYRARAPRLRARRAAFAELGRIRAESDDRVAADALQRLLRRYALTLFGAERIAELCGPAWIRFVVDQGGAALSGESGEAFLTQAFGGTVPHGGPVPRESWFEAAEGFIRRASRRRLKQNA